MLQDPAKQIVGATVESELAFGPENQGLPRAEIVERIRDVAAQAGIEPLLGRETAALSGGERQLLAIAAILMMRPSLYVVDEPLANLDPATAERLLTLLRELADEGAGIVIVEHRVEEALALRPDRVLYLEEGRTRYLGSVDGFLDIADPAAVKLPFDVVLRRVRAEGAGQPPPLAAGAAASAEPTAPADRQRPEPHRRVSNSATSRAAIGETAILHGVDARLGQRRGRRGPRPQRLRQDHALPDGDAAARHHAAGRSWSMARPHAGRPHGGARHRIRLRLPEPEPDAVRPHGRGRAPVRPAKHGPRSGHVR